MKLITACLLGLLTFDVYALDCWGYMNKPKEIRDACMAQANAKLSRQPTAEQREVEERNRNEALQRLESDRSYVQQKEDERAFERAERIKAQEVEERRQQEIARHNYEIAQREREVRAQEAAAAAAVAAAASANRAAEAAKPEAAAPRLVRCNAAGWCM